MALLAVTAASPESQRRRRVRLPVLAVTGLAWVVLVSWMALGGDGMGGSTGATMDMGAGMGTAMSLDPAMPMSSSLGWGVAVGMWGLMLVAMMAPLLIQPLRHVGDRSLPQRAPWARTLFAAAYTGVWAVAGLGLIVLGRALGRLGPDIALAVAIGAALVWQATPLQQRCLNQHHGRPPLSAMGRRADLDALRYGLSQGRWCVGSCWALMLVPLVYVDHPLLAMAVVTVMIWSQQISRPAPARWHIPLSVPARSREQLHDNPLLRLGRS